MTIREMLKYVKEMHVIDVFNLILLFMSILVMIFIWFAFSIEGILNKVLVVASLAFWIITLGVINSIAIDDFDQLSTWASLALVDFVFLLIGFWGADY
jgi:hypothetical protein